MADIIDIKAERKKLEQKIAQDNSVDVALEDLTPGSSIYPNREETESHVPDLKEMNFRYAFVHNYGGKSAIKTTVFNEFYNKEIVDFITVDTLYAIYANRIAEETRANKNGGTQLGKWWILHPHRKDYISITFEPNKAPGEYHVIDKFKFIRSQTDKSEDVHVTYFNTWEGFGLEPKKGSWKKLRIHIYKILCNSNKKKYKYVLNWLAWAVQNPGKRAEVALIFKGKKGAGKGIVLQAMCEIFGRHGLVISNREHLTGKHNQHLATCSFLFADEAYYPGDKEVEGILKNLITEPSLTTEPKFRELKIGNNCLHIAMATNADWIIPATEDERRYFINEVDNRYAKGQSSDYERENYFNLIWEERKNGGLEAMLYDLQNKNLTNWHPRNSVPETEELRRQIAMSLPKLKYAFMQLLEDGSFPGSMNGKGEYIISNKNLLEYIQGLETNNKSITNKSLSKLCAELNIPTSRTSETRHYIFPELGTLREAWHQKITKNSEWRTNETWEVNTKY